MCCKLCQNFQTLDKLSAVILHCVLKNIKFPNFSDRRAENFHNEYKHFNVPVPASFSFIFVHLSSQFKYKLKKHWCCAWDQTRGRRMVGSYGSPELRWLPYKSKHFPWFWKRPTLRQGLQHIVNHVNQPFLLAGPSQDVFLLSHIP